MVAIMKIHQLPMGARFEYEGEEYVKTGPLVASGKGGLRLIPRYAVLKVVGAVEPLAPPTQPAVVPRARVLAAFEAYHARCAALVPADGQDALAAAREDFLGALAA